MNTTKIEKNVGLPILMLSKLVNVLGGSFKTLTKDKIGKVTIEFCLPFGSSKSMRNMIKTPKVSLKC